MGMTHLRPSTREQHGPGYERDPASEVVRVWLLGGFRVSVGSSKVGEGEWRLRKAASLVKLLVISPNHRLHREVVMDRLWPDLGPEEAANNLRQALHVARRAFERSPTRPHRYLWLKDGEIVLCPEGALWVDVDAFEEAAETARLSREPAAYRTAIELYTGELLPGDRYEEWVEGRREELRRIYITLLDGLAGTHESQQEYEPAIEAARRALSEEPSREEAHARLMRLYALSGRKTEALRQFDRLEEILSRELGAEPDAEIRRLREEISSGDFPEPPRREPEDVPSDAGSHNLPLARDSFVGREQEIVEVKRALSMTGLLTLTGPGGCGKTRLSLEVARQLVGSFPDGVWLVELAALSDPALVTQEAASSLGVREQPGRPLTDTLVRTIREKKLLLVLDNCEHLIDAAAHLADMLLDSCPGLRILATSREHLGVTGEITWRVRPLSMPDAERLPAAEDLTRYESVRLFQERAQLKLPAFEITPQNARSVAEVCRRLDGIPLAIELATARMAVLAVEQVAERLEDSLKLLTGGTRTASPRQQTMRAALEWSYELLSAAERRIFGRLSVFAGGLNLEAAEAVLPGQGVERRDVLDLVSALVEKSLLVAEFFPGREGQRYRMLESVRQYAREKLDESDEVGLVLRRHAEFFLELAEQATPQLRGPQQIQCLERLTREHDNLRAAMAWTLEEGEWETFARVGWALWLFWWIRGHFTEGRRWMEKALAKGGAMRPSDRANVLFVAGTMATGQADYRVAEPMIEESTRLFRKLRDERGTALALGTAGIAAVNQERYEEGIALLEEASSLYQKLGDEWGHTAVLVSSAGAWLALGDHGRAEQTAEEGLALSRKIGDRTGISIALYVLAMVAHASEDHERAKGLFGEGLTLAAELGDKANIVYYLEELATGAASEGKLRRAARLWGAAEALLGTIEATAYPHRPDRSLHQRQVAAARARLDETSWTAAFSEGRTITQEEAIAYALSEEEPAAAPVAEKATAGTLSESLTRREREVAALVAQGLTNRRVAEEFFLSERTVETHVRNVLKKLGLNSRAQLAALAADRG